MIFDYKFSIEKVFHSYLIEATELAFPIISLFSEKKVILYNV
jgi:hypothetical protein